MLHKTPGMRVNLIRIEGGDKYKTVVRAVRAVSHAVRVDERSSYNTNLRRRVMGRATTFKERDDPTGTEIHRR